MVRHLSLTLAALAAVTVAVGQSLDHNVFPGSDHQVDSIQKLAREFVDKAYKLIDAGNYSEAERVARRGLDLVADQTYPMADYARFALGEALMRENKNMEALQALRSAKSSQKDLATYGRIGLLTLRLGDFDKSNAMWEEAFTQARYGRGIEEMPKVTNHASLEGAWLLLIGINEGMSISRGSPIFYLEKAAKLIPNDFATEEHLGGQYIIAGKYNLAIKALQIAVAHGHGLNKQLASQALDTARWDLAVKEPSATVSGKKAWE